MFFILTERWVNNKNKEFTKENKCNYKRETTNRKTELTIIKVVKIKL